MLIVCPNCATSYRRTAVNGALGARAARATI
jgi:predicted Zn finger-like uncharacterized protein